MQAARYADHQAEAIVHYGSPKTEVPLRKSKKTEVKETSTGFGSESKHAQEEIKMSMTRRQALASGAAVIAGAMVKPAIAAKEPILIGYLPALTGPSSSTGVGI